MTKGELVISDWLKSKNWKAAPFQKECMHYFLDGYSGILNAPTGSGKTYALWMPVLAAYINEVDDHRKKQKTRLRTLWITPLKALTKDIQRALQEACDEMEIPWKIGSRTGDTSAKERSLQKKEMPETLMITPESLHVLLSQKNNSELFNDVTTVIVDEWHELLGSKRGVQTELALARLKTYSPALKIWGISATIGNLNDALYTLLGKSYYSIKHIIVRAESKKRIVVKSIIPDEVEKYPWAGHLGIRLIDKIIPLIENSQSTLIFTNTRSQTEIWYRQILERYPDLSGLIALHHGSLDREVRNWVENALHAGTLKAVICTSSLDLGVDFRPVETIIQIGSPKSISRFLQRAGRSGHQPGAESRIWFLPTHSLELVEAASLKEAINDQVMEDRVPVINAYDVLIQYMVTVAVADGFDAKELFDEVTSTYCFQFLTEDEWFWLLDFIVTGGSTLYAYDEFKKVEIEEGIYKVKNRGVALRHRLSIGTIVSDSSLKVQLIGGKFLGTIEESFIAKYKPGDVFWFAGRNLELVRIRDMTVSVRKSSAKKGSIPSWMGGRMSLSSQFSIYIRKALDAVLANDIHHPELKALKPIFDLQQYRSVIPSSKELLIEQVETGEGYHTFVFPFEGRLVHEGMAALMAYRIGKIVPVTYSIAMNDYGFELLSDKFIDVEELLSEYDIFTAKHLNDDIRMSLNSSELARRKFRDIARISGMIFSGYPGKYVRTKHLQSSTSLLFDVIREHEPTNLLILQAYQEVFDQQLEEKRLFDALNRISTQKIIVVNTENPTPFAFPIMVDRLREQMTSETLTDRIKKMVTQYTSDN